MAISPQERITSIAPDALAMPFWSLGMVLVWIATRDPQHVISVALEDPKRAMAATIARFAGQTTDGAFQDALRALHTGLLDARLPSTGVRGEGGERQAIEAMLWNDLRIDLQIDGASDSGRFWVKVRLERERVLALWPAKPSAMCQVSRSEPALAAGLQTSDPKQPRGRAVSVLQKADQASRIREVVAKAKRKWPDPGKAPAFQAMAIDLCPPDGKGKCAGYSAETTRKILEGKYKPQIRARIGGYRA